MELREYLINKSVSECGYKESVTVARSAPVREAIRVMQDKRVACVLVTDQRTLCGILTERDLLRKVFASGRSLDLPVSDVMTPDPVVGGPNEPLFRVLSRMHSGGFRHVPVVGDSGEALGTVSIMRVARLLADSFAGALANGPSPTGGPSGRGEE